MGWGLGAIVALALAIVTANLAAFLPASWLTGLHATSQQGGNLTLLKAEVATLRAELSRSERASALLTTRMALIEDNRTSFARRVGALEASVPVLLKTLPDAAGIDYSLLTAGIGNAEEFPAEGGTLVIRRTPLFAAAQPMPAPPGMQAEPAAFGLALGAAIIESAAPGAWREFAATAGTILIGLHPLLALDENGDGARRLVAGPVASYDEALRLCAAISLRDVACQAASFDGTALPGTR
ncbi:MAG: hypothetical protein WEB63_01520 [Cucumibacter sp.]